MTQFLSANPTTSVITRNGRVSWPDHNYSYHLAARISSQTDNKTN